MIFTFSIVLGAKYSFYVQSIATYGPTFLECNNLVLVILLPWHYFLSQIISKYNLIHLALIGTFSSDQIQVGGLYEFDKNDGCDGKMIVVPKFRKANLV